MVYRMDQMSWSEFDQRRKETDTIIVPTGACEIYGPHLPMGADAIAAMAISERVAERTGALIAPMIPIGESNSLTCYPGTITFSKSTFELIIKELFENLVKYGFKHFLFVTGHAGNVDAISYYARQFQTKYDIKCGQIDWWRFTQSNCGEIFDYKGPMAHGHASECGTSVMMYLYPELVDHDEITCVKNIPNNYPDVLQYSHFTEKTPNGSIGDSTVATIEKGKAIVEACVDRIMDYLKNAF